MRVRISQRVLLAMMCTCADDKDDVIFFVAHLEASLNTMVEQYLVWYPLCDALRGWTIGASDD